jgi:hypothetical protein
VAGNDSKAERNIRMAAHAGRQAGTFFKHVLPAAVKPVHSLWHEVLSFIFLAFAGIAVWKVWRDPTPVRIMMLTPLILILAGYGISSWRKSRRISRS